MNEIHKPMRSLPSNQASRQGLPLSVSRDSSFTIHSEPKPWRSSEAVRSPLPRDHPITSRKAFASINSLPPRRRPVRRAPASRSSPAAHRLAHASVGASTDCHRRMRLDTVRRRTRRGGASGGRDLVPTEPSSLARGNPDDLHDPHRHPGGARRQDGELDGEGDRRAIPRRSHAQQLR